VTIVLARPLRSGLAVPAVVALVAVVTFIGLGSWQLQRKAWKEALIESLEQRLSAPPGDLPVRERWASLVPASDEFRRVKFSAAFVPGAEALVYTSGSALRSDVSGPGYWVFAPARVASGGSSSSTEASCRTDDKIRRRGPPGRPPATPTWSA
jgi:cytochrome oxidase assembly protein ShyY1